MAESKKEVAKFDAKAMIAENAKNETVIKYNERMKVEIIKATKFYTVGSIQEPHLIKAKALIKQGIAKAVK